MHSFHLLLVDDHENIRFTFRLALESDGYDVDTADTIAAAQAKIEVRCYDVLVLARKGPSATSTERSSSTRNATSPPRGTRLCLHAERGFASEPAEAFARSGAAATHRARPLRIGQKLPDRNFSHLKPTTMQKVSVKKSTALFAVTIASLAALTSARAGDATSSPSPSPTPELSPAEKTAAKLKYNLFNPTPDSQLRPFNTDRPSKTDSPITVDAGRFQLEADFANFTYDRYNALRTNTRVETLLVTPTFLKVGLLENVDFQVLIPTYEWIRTDARDVNVTATTPMTGPGSTGTTTTTQTRRQITTVDGYGDMLFRLKVNLIGDEGGPFLAAVIPFIKAPTASSGVGNGRVEGGINFPINYSLPAGFTLFAQTRYDFLYNGDNDGYHTLFSNNIGAVRAVPGILDGKLSAYGEFASAISSRESRTDPLVLTADTGLIFQLTPNIAIDLNGFFGLSRGAPDVNVFGGIGVRF